jgi:hypothetical protein
MAHAIIPNANPRETELQQLQAAAAPFNHANLIILTMLAVRGTPTMNMQGIQLQ